MGKGELVGLKIFTFLKVFKAAHAKAIGIKKGTLLSVPFHFQSKTLTTVAENTQQHQEQVDEIQIQRQRANNRIFAEVIAVVC